MGKLGSKSEKSLMKKVLPLLFIILTNLSYGQSKNRLTQLDNMDFSSLYFISSTNKFIIDYLKIPEKEPIPYEYFDGLRTCNKTELLTQLNSHLNKFSEAKSKAVVDSVLIWKQIATAIQFPFQIKGTNLTEYLELIANIESSSHLVKRYIKIDGQYWGSLSSFQANELYYDLMNHLLQLNGVSRLKFFQEYYRKAYEHGK